MKNTLTPDPKDRQIKSINNLTFKDLTAYLYPSGPLLGNKGSPIWHAVKQRVNRGEHL